MNIDSHELRRNEDPSTSAKAANEIVESLGMQHARITDALRRIVNGTVYEISAATGGALGAHQVHKRIADLHRLQTARVCLDAEGNEVVRNGPTGRQCRVWELVPELARSRPAAMHQVQPTLF